MNTMLNIAAQSIMVSEARPINHSNRGGHYRWPGWLERISVALGSALLDPLMAVSTDQAVAITLIINCRTAYAIERSKSP
jgi:hypothetical protein